MRDDDEDDRPRRESLLRIGAITVLGSVAASGVIAVAWWLSSALMPG